MRIEFLNGTVWLLMDMHIIAATKNKDTLGLGETIEIRLNGSVGTYPDHIRKIGDREVSPEEFKIIWNKLMYLEQKSRL